MLKSARYDAYIKDIHNSDRFEVILAMLHQHTDENEKSQEIANKKGWLLQFYGRFMTRFTEKTILFLFIFILFHFYLFIYFLICIVIQKYSYLFYW